MFLGDEIEQKLADMSEEDWHALTARVRPPSTPVGGVSAGLAEARRRGFIDEQGNRIGGTR